uniref:CTLH domain-containing protein n=1 Tax=Meloidogyne floridensis TaxID=298350 RepID=A0A915PA02_9BILA
MFFKIIILLIFIPKENAFPNPFNALCNLYNAKNFLFNPLDGSAEKMLENYYKEFLSAKDPDQIDKMYMKISIVSHIFMVDLAMDIKEPGREIGFLLRKACLYPLFIPYKAALCFLISFKGEYNEQLKKKIYGKKYKKLPKLNCFLTDLTKFDEIIKEYQEEIWDTNFIVFVKSFTDPNTRNNVNRSSIEKLNEVFGPIRLVVLQEKFPEYLFKLEDEDIEDNLIELINDSLIVNETKYQQWRILHVLDYFLYKGWYKINIENKEGIEQIKIIWKTIFENYWNGNNFLKEFVLNFDESEEEDSDEEDDEEEILEMFFNPKSYSTENFEVHLKYLFVMKECTENKNIEKEVIKNCINREMKKNTKKLERNLRKQKIIEILSKKTNEELLKLKIKTLKSNFYKAKGLSILSKKIERQGVNENDGI